MDLELAGRTALVTAASRGIGRAVAAALAREGCRVIATSSDAAAVEKTAREIAAEARGADVSARVIDVRTPSSIEQGLDEILAETPVDVLVTNGPGPPPVEAASVSDQELAAALQANLLSVIAMCRRVLPGMSERGFGRIVNLVSSVAREPDEGMVLSAVARAGVLAYAKTLSREVARRGVTVNSILTASVMTDRTRELLEHEAGTMNVPMDRFLDEAAATIPAGYIVAPEDFVPAIVFLASPRAAYVNGVSLAVDGGYMRAL